MESDVAVPKQHMKQKSVGTIMVKRPINVGKRPDKPPPVPPGATKQPQNDNKPTPVEPKPSEVPLSGAAPTKYEFVPIDIDDMINKLNDEINDMLIPGQKTIDDVVEEDGLTPTPPDQNSTSNTRSNSTVSDNSAMSNTHGSVDSTHQSNGGISPRSAIPAHVKDPNPGPRSASEGTVAKPLDLKEKFSRFHSNPLKPDQPITKVTVISPGKQPPPVPTSSPPSASIDSPTTPNGPHSLPALRPFGMDSYSGADSSPARSLASSSGAIVTPPKKPDQLGTPKQGSPSTPKKVLRVNADGLIIVSKNFVTTIKGGVLDRIIDYLVRQPSRDTDSTNAFLLNYRKFIEPSQLLEILFTKLHNAKNESTSSSDQVALRCINLIQYWVSSHYHDFADDHELLSDLQERLTQLNDDRANPIQKTIKTQEAKYRSLLAKPPMTILNPNAKKVNLLDFKPAIVSQQLCLFEHELFRAIHPKEFLNQNWEKHKEKAPNICRMVAWFNALADWISGGILQAATNKEREKLTKFWIEVADQCRINNNFNAVQEIMSAFTGNSLYRLKPLWEKINKSKKCSVMLDTLRQVIDPVLSHKVYREALKGVVGACIPFMSLILKDLIHIEDGNPNMLPVEGRNDIINFDKAMRISAIIGHQSPSILGFQTELYQFPKVEAVYNIFNNGLCVLSEDERYQLSLKIVPKKTAK